jgi:hypothetical protein
MNKRIKFIILLSGISFMSFSCSSDFLETASTSSVDQAQMFETTSSAMMAVNGIHRLMYLPGSSAAQCGYGTFMLWMDMMGEDLVYTKGNAQWQSQAKWTLHRNTTSSHNKFLYKFFYSIISNANMILDNIDNANGLQEEKDYIKGQALTYKAFAHFSLVQLWGERYYPGQNNTQDGIVIKLDNSLEPLPRSSVEDVYTVINDDLDNAIELLEKVNIKRNSITHINIHVARAIKARVLLTQGKWMEAAQMAQLVVENSGASLQADTYAFKQGRMCDATNKEWIWGKIGQPTLETGTLTNFFSFISNTNVSYNKNTPRAIYNLLYNRISSTDVRKQVWLPDAPLMDRKLIAYPPAGNIFKWMSQKYIVDYPDNTSSLYLGNVYTADLPYIRLPEMILIMAEGYARAGSDQLAAQALYRLAAVRDPQYMLSTNTGEALIDEIMFQRRIELWGEGFRFLDLKRLNMNLDRGPAPRPGYNQGGSANGWKSGQNPKNLDPLASNYNMYDDQGLGEENRFKAANSIEWQFVFPQSEIDYNPLCKQNPI